MEPGLPAFASLGGSPQGSVLPRALCSYADARAPLRANTVEVEAWGVAAVRGVGGCGVEQAAGGGSVPRPPGVVLLSGF